MVALLRTISVLSEHEALGTQMSTKMRSEYGERLVACFDFSGALQLKSMRGDCNEFFSPISLSLFGIMFVVPRPGGGYCHRYIDVFSFGNDHASKFAASALKCGATHAEEIGFISGIGNGASWYSDKGKHFCSGEMVYRALFDISGKSQDVSRTFWVCYHGKTALDGHFARLKDRSKHIVVGKWPKNKMEIESAIMGAAKKMPNTGAVFLENFSSQSTKKAKVIPNISCVQTVYRKTDPITLKDTLIVENTQIPIRVKTTQRNGGTSAREAGPVARGGCNSESVTELCGKLSEQQGKLKRYRDSR